MGENRAVGVNIGTPVSALDMEEDTLRYSLDGDDASSFDIVASTGQLRAGESFDYETKSTYTIRVSVSDGLDSEGNADDAVDDTVAVIVLVINLDDDGTVSISPGQSRVGAVLRARADDQDGISGSVVWQWEKSPDRISWTAVSGAGSSNYTPVESDSGYFLRAIASYTDGHGLGNTAELATSGAVGSLGSAPDLEITEVVPSLTIPWGIDFAPDGTMLTTERGGTIRIRLPGSADHTATADMSDLYASGEAGLMDILVDPDFSTNRRFYTCQTHTDMEVQVIGWAMNAEYTSATRVLDPLVGDIPASGRHSGCRLRFGPHNYLWIATGDAASGTVPQDLNSLGGKVLRVDSSTGAGAPGNPYPQSPRIYSYGHRNVQGLALRPGTSQMWSVEHGPDYDDEINLLTAGGNYGWDPVPGYYENVPMTDLVKFPGAVESKWSSGYPTLATAGGVFLEGSLWGVWEGRLAVASLKDRSLRVFEFTSGGDLVSEIVVSELGETYR